MVSASSFGPRRPATTLAANLSLPGKRFRDPHFSVMTLATGVYVKTIAERHGPTQASTTLNRYAPALPERDREAADILGRTLALISLSLPIRRYGAVSVGL